MFRQQEVFSPINKTKHHQDVQNYTAAGISPVRIEEYESDDQSHQQTYDQINVSSTINDKRKGQSNIRIKQEVASVIQGKISFDNRNRMYSSQPEQSKFN